MSLAVTFWEGWVAAHPVTLLVSGALAVLWVLFVAAYYRLTGDEGAPQSPRRGTRSRARGTRARRRVSQRARRRARATAGGTSWGRQAIALRIHGITTGAGGDPPAGITKNAGHGASPDQGAPVSGGLRLPARPRRAVLAARARRAALGALRASVYPGRPGQKACPRCGAPHKEPHCADGREWGPFPGPETPANAHGITTGVTLPSRGDAQEREGGCAPSESRPAAGADLTGLLSPRQVPREDLNQEGPRAPGAPPPVATRQPARLATGAGQDAARLDYQPAPPFAGCLSDDTIARGMKAVQ